MGQMSNQSNAYVPTLGSVERVNQQSQKSISLLEYGGGDSVIKSGRDRSLPSDNASDINALKLSQDSYRQNGVL